MIIPKVGEIIYENDDTKKIFNTYPDFFEEGIEFEILVTYKIIKEPSEELKKAIDIYNKEQKRRNYNRDKFVESTAEKVLSRLSEKDKKYIFNNPASNDHHFGLGLIIRNEYIYSEDLNFECWDIDTLSSEIVTVIASKIIPNFDIESRYYRYIYDSSAFSKMRLIYFSVFGKYPDELVDKYRDDVNYIDAIERCEKEITEKVMNINQCKEMCYHYGISEEIRDEFIKFANTYYKEEGCLLPYNLIILSSTKIEADVRQKWLHTLSGVLYADYRLATKIPVSILNQKDAVSVVVKANGEAIQHVSKRFRKDIDLIKLALDNKSSEALKLPCMFKYRDNIEFVKIALKSNGYNIEFVSPRLRDDIEAWIEHSLEEKRNVCDSDNLFEHNLKEKLRLMSKRIQKIYNAEE